MAPNIELARKFLSSVEGASGKFAQYSAAYTITNEDLRHAYKFMPKNAEDVLTVAASGDHPIFAMLYGAKNVDTFDISYNAKCIMDIKTAALQVLNRLEYCNLLEDLWAATDIQNIKNMDKIIPLLPIEEQKYMIDMRGLLLFNHGLATRKKQLPTETEFNDMCKIIHKPFNFIWSDITSLHHHLNKSYDFIHLSNILDSMDEDNRILVLFNMMRYIKPNGVLFFQNHKAKPTSLYYYCEELEKENKEKWNICKSKTDCSFHIMQRVH